MKEKMLKKLKELKNPRQTLVLLILACLLLLVSIIGFIVIQKDKPAMPVEDRQALLSGDAYGVLVLGSDQGAKMTNGGNHTDSVTYVAINKTTNKAYALPIYRDSFIFNTCTEQEININHVYRDNGADCLMKSVAKLLDLPVDYYVYITANGFVDFFNKIGPLTMTPEASYCSEFGNDNREHCFTEGQTQDLNGNELLAYARFRGPTSGERRAERHVQILNKGYEVCMGDKLACGVAVMQGVQTSDIQTNMPYEEVIALESFPHLELLSTLTGANFEDANGWHHRILQSDLEEKTALIRAEIFSA